MAEEMARETQDMVRRHRDEQQAWNRNFDRKARGDGLSIQVAEFLGDLLLWSHVMNLKGPVRFIRNCR